MAERLIPGGGGGSSQSGGFSAWTRPGGQGGERAATRDPGAEKNKNKKREKNKKRDNNRVQRLICTKEGDKNTAMEEVGGGSWRREPPLLRERMRSDSRAAAGAQHACHRALNYASLSFHQPQHGRADKERRRRRRCRRRRGAPEPVVTVPAKGGNI